MAINQTAKVPPFMEHLQRALEEDLGEIAELADSKNHHGQNGTDVGMTPNKTASQPLYITSHFDNAISSLVSHCQHLEKNVYFKDKFPPDEPRFYCSPVASWQEERNVARLHYKAYKDKQEIISGVGKVYAELDRCLTAAKFKLDSPPPPK